MFGLAVRWKRNRRDPLAELAKAIEAIGEDDRKLLDENVRVERLRERGAAELHLICDGFVQSLNDRLSHPALTLDPPTYSGERFTGGAPSLFQINLRGRLLQIEFSATEELSSTEEFRRAYILSGTVRSFNQDFLIRDHVDEKNIFYCPEADSGRWHYFDSRTYGAGTLTPEFLAEEMARLI